MNIIKLVHVCHYCVTRERKVRSFIYMYTDITIYLQYNKEIDACTNIYTCCILFYRSLFENSIIISMRYYVPLPSHNILEHILFTGRPLHPWIFNGLVCTHLRLIDCWPTPHVTEHSLQSPQPVQRLASMWSD